MDTDLLSLDPRTVYKLLCAVAVPRPTAWVTTLGEDGTVNGRGRGQSAAIAHHPTPMH